MQILLLEDRSDACFYSSGTSPDGHSLSDISHIPQPHGCIPHHPVDLCMPIFSKCSPISFSSNEPSWLQTSPWVELRFLESPPNLVLLDMSFGFHFPFKNMLSLCFQYLTRMLNASFSQSSPAECRHSPPVQPRAPCPAAPHGPPIPPGICSTLGLCQLLLRPGEGEPVGDYW